MHYSVIKKFDVANGPGVRVSLFVSGCTHHCKGCFNPETWDFSFGQRFTEETEQEILNALKPDYIRGLSLLGGEPFEPVNQGTLRRLVRKVREQYPEKTIWCYSGYRMEELLDEGNPVHTWDTRALLEDLDVLVDGVFVEALKNLRLRFRGSSNQRILDVQKSLQGEIVVIPMDEEA